LKQIETKAAAACWLIDGRAKSIISRIIQLYSVIFTSGAVGGVDQGGPVVIVGAPTIFPVFL
jgi:hypothetical protein